MSSSWLYASFGLSALLLILGAYALITAQAELASGRRTITLVGEVVCLPHKKPWFGLFGGSQTDECTFGFLGEDGRHYGINYLDSETVELLQNAGGSGQLFKVTGAIRIPAPYKGLDRYDIVGSIDVASATPIQGNFTDNDASPNLWRMRTIAINGTRHPEFVWENNYTLHINATHISGKICNGFGGDVQYLDNSTIRGNVFVTRMLCGITPGGGSDIMEVEELFLDGLVHGMTISERNDKLELRDIVTNTTFIYSKDYSTS
jgi:heat shock protein HslJ